MQKRKSFNQHVSEVTTYVAYTGKYNFDVWYVSTLFWNLPSEHLHKYANLYLSIINLEDSFLYTFYTDYCKKYTASQAEQIMYIRTIFPNFYPYATGFVTPDQYLFAYMVDILDLKDWFAYKKPSEFSIQINKIITPFILIYICFIWFGIAAIIIVTSIVLVETYIFNSSTVVDFLYFVSTLKEAEKEIGSIDDLVVGVLILVGIFFWYFAIIGFLFFINNYTSYHIYMNFPILLAIVLFLPLNILYDYGVMCLSYLRGVGTTTILLLELMYDVLATVIMFVRLTVQNVRFFLMFFAYFELCEFLYVLGLPNSTDVSDIYEIVSFNNFVQSPVKTSFLGILLFPAVLMKWLYQIAHLTFTVTSQFIAYLALVFWLFSFLYTGFFDIRIETYFKQKREKMKTTLTSIINIWRPTSPLT